MEEEVQLKKANKELEDVKEKYIKSDRNLKYVKEIIESYKKDRQDLENKVKQTNEEIDLIKKQLTDGKVQELNDFRHTKKLESVVKITNRRVKQFEEFSTNLNEKISSNDMDTNNSFFDDKMEEELMSRIKICKEKIDVLVKECY